jgi:trehalose 2-sulfotransferase
LLCRLLGATGVAGKPESYLRLPDEPSYAERWGVRTGPEGVADYREYLRAAVRAGSTTNGVFAVRVMWGTMEPVVARLRTAQGTPVGPDLEVLERDLGPTSFVHLQRDDVVAQAISWAKAEQTGYWHAGDGTASGRRPRFSFDEIDGFVRTVKEHNAAWREWFQESDIVPQVVFYEDLVTDMAGTASVIMRFLGLDLPVGHRFEPPTPKQADEVNQIWARQYRSRRPLGA